jgi:hypothetical protein
MNEINEADEPSPDGSAPTPVSAWNPKKRQDEPGRIREQPGKDSPHDTGHDPSDTDKPPPVQ